MYTFNIYLYLGKYPIKKLDGLASKDHETEVLSKRAQLISETSLSSAAGQRAAHRPLRTEPTTPTF